MKDKSRQVDELFMALAMLVILDEELSNWEMPMPEWAAALKAHEGLLYPTYRMARDLGLHPTVAALDLARSVVFLESLKKE